LALFIVLCRVVSSCVMYFVTNFMPECCTTEFEDLRNDMCVYVYMYVFFLLFIKACPITLGNTTCRVNLVVHQEAPCAVSLYIFQNFFDSSFVTVSQSLLIL